MSPNFERSWDFFVFIMNYIVYILHSIEIRKYYVGYTSDIDQRIDLHLNPIESGKYTSKVTDWKIFYQIECESKSQAMSIECHIKKMKSKIYIENLIRYPEITDKLLLKYRL
jgi:putative endonuclease